MTRVRIGSAVFVAFFLLCTCAMAGTIKDYNRATFAAALMGGTVSGQNFDGIASGTIISTVNGVTYAASLGSPLVTDAYLTTTPPNGLGSTSVGFFEPAETATMTFGSAITAFAIDINTFATANGAYEVTLNDGTTVLSLFDVFPGGSTGQFLGFTDSVPFTSVTISSLDGYSYTLDSLVYGNAAAISATPEPSTLLLFGTSLLGLASFRRKLFGR
jgi:PEP-CTERM motif